MVGWGPGQTASHADRNQPCGRCAARADPFPAMRRTLASCRPAGAPSSSRAAGA